MSAYIIFVRFFLDLRGFPYERFACLRDDEIVSELKKVRKEEKELHKKWMAIPENRREFKGQQREQQKRIEEWNNASLAKPGRSGPRAAGVNRKKVAQREAAADYSIGDETDKITHRYPLAEIDNESACVTPTKGGNR